MVTLITLALIIGVATAVGLFLGGSLLRFAVLTSGGLLAIMLAFVEAVVLRNPTGEGWVNREKVYGHWVPTWQANLMFWSALAWLVPIFMARAVRSSRRASTGSTDPRVD